MAKNTKSRKEKAYEHKQFSGDGLADGAVSQAGVQLSSVHALCSEPKASKQFLFGYLAGRIGDHGNQENGFVPSVYVPFLLARKGAQTQTFGSDHCPHQYACFSRISKASCPKFFDPGSRPE